MKRHYFTLLLLFASCKPITINCMMDEVQEEESTSILELLLEHAYPHSLDQKDDKGYTPLMYAIANINVTKTSLLLEYKANPNTQDLEGNTPLMFAVCEGNADIVQLLLKYRADITIKNDAGQTALDIAQDFSNKEIIKLLQSPDNNQKIKWCYFI